MLSWSHSNNSLDESSKEDEYTIHEETGDEEADKYSNNSNFCFEDCHVNENYDLASDAVYIGHVCGIDDLIALMVHEDGVSAF